MGLPTPAKKYLWTQKLPILVRAMVLAPDTLFLAGPPDFFATDDPAAALAGTKGGTLIALSTADGSKLAGRRQNKTSILPKRGTVTYFSIASQREIGDCPHFPFQKSVSSLPSAARPGVSFSAAKPSLGHKV